MSAINNSVDRLFEYDGSVFQFVDNTGNRRVVFIQDFEVNFNMDDFDIDRIDTAAPIFTKKSDILGTWSFNIKSTIDLFDTGSALSPITYAFWATQIAAGEPPTIDFLLTQNAPNSTGDKFGNIRYQGRVMTTPFTRVRDRGVFENLVTGEITNLTSISRTATAL